VATQTAYRDWAGETDEILATVLDVLDKQAKEVKKRGRHR